MNRSELQKKRWLNPEYKKHMSDVHMGQTAWNKNKKLGKNIKHSIAMTGRKASEETKKRMSDVRKGKMPKNISTISGWNKGIRHSNETKKKISLSRLGKCSGSDNNLWRGGRMQFYPENEKIRKSSEIMLWKKACMERDNFTCQKTGQRGGRLVVHHINNFADFPELRTSISNGVTLSVEAHREFHKKYGVKNNTREQLLEFLNK
jgi:hypothetical protein